VVIPPGVYLNSNNFCDIINNKNNKQQ